MEYMVDYTADYMMDYTVDDTVDLHMVDDIVNYTVR